MRIGIGYDLHRLIPVPQPEGFPLGGITIPCAYRVEAHSDGDVLLHAAVDACLGALALGDIGLWFPDHLPENQKRPSSEFVQIVLGELERLGYRVVQVDSIVFLEEPKIGVYATAIRRSMASQLRLEMTDVSLKAKTLEGVGAIGERKAIAAQVIVAVDRL